MTQHRKGLQSAATPQDDARPSSEVAVVADLLERIMASTLPRTAESPTQTGSTRARIDDIHAYAKDALRVLLLGDARMLAEKGECVQRIINSESSLAESRTDWYSVHTQLQAIHAEHRRNMECVCSDAEAQLDAAKTEIASQNQRIEAMAEAMRLFELSDDQAAILRELDDWKEQAHKFESMAGDARAEADAKTAELEYLRDEMSRQKQALTLRLVSAESDRQAVVEKAWRVDDLTRQLYDKERQEIKQILAYGRVEDGLRAELAATKRKLFQIQASAAAKAAEADNSE